MTRPMVGWWEPQIWTETCDATHTSFFSELLSFRVLQLDNILNLNKKETLLLQTTTVESV